MAIGKICNRIVVVVTDSDSVTTAAELMRDQGHYEKQVRRTS